MAVNFDSSTGALHPWYTMIANMPAQNIVAYQDQLQTGATITFYIEDLEGKRQIYRQFSTSRFNRLMEVDKQSIDGFTFYEWKRNKDSMVIPGCIILVILTRLLLKTVDGLPINGLNMRKSWKMSNRKQHINRMVWMKITYLPDGTPRRLVQKM